MAENPINILDFDRALNFVQQRLSLQAVVQAYGATLTERSDGHYKMTCVLPSLEPGCSSTCADNDGSGATNAKTFPVPCTAGYHRWYCYSCKRGGDVTDFIAHAEGWPMNDQRNMSLRALRRAANWAGCEYLMDGRKRIDGVDEPSEELLTDVEASEVTEAPPPKVDAAKAFGLNEMVAKFWRDALQDSPEALAWLHGRGITDRQIKKYGLGYALGSWDRLLKRINKKHHPLAVRLGLLKFSGSNTLHDVQRDRLIFPYFQPALGGSGFNVTGFAGRRRLDNDPKVGKFCNSLNVADVWTKSGQLFGMYQARTAASKLNRLTVCEGPADALAFDRLGIPAVALVGTALTLGHVHAVEQHIGFPRVTLALDGDATGRRPVLTWVRAFVLRGFDIDAIDIIDCDDGQDPDEMDPDELRSRWENPTPARDYLLALGVGLPEAPPTVSPLVRELQRQETTLADALRNHTLGDWQTVEEYRAWFAAKDVLLMELAKVRRQLAATV